MFKYKSNARENQDIVALCLFGGKKNGTYLEVGANHPIIDSNTFLLEDVFDWHGVSIEINTHLSTVFNNTRKNKCLGIDATVADYDSIIDTHFNSTHIDFLQLDIDPPNNTLKALKQIDFSKYSFSFITFEHDLYNGGLNEQIESRAILESLGYTRFFSNVSHGNLVFEDWYINEKTIDNSNWKLLRNENVNMNSSDMPVHVRDVIYNILETINE